MILAASANEAFRLLTECVLDGGIETRPRGGRMTKELLSFGLVIENPRDRLITCPPRQPRLDYSVAGLGWNLQERSDAETICFWNPNGWGFADRYGKNEEFHGANYGERIVWQIEKAIELLKKEPESRRAWISVWDQHTEVDNGYFFDGKDVPCTVGFGIRLIQGKLVMQTVMRSQSVVGVFPYDSFLFLTLQELIANELGVDVGHYIHTCNSAHIYENELEFAQNIVTWYGEHGDGSTPMDKIEYGLKEAGQRWWTTQEMLRKGESFPDGFTPDQFEQLLISGAENRAKARAN